MSSHMDTTRKPKWLETLKHDPHNLRFDPKVVKVSTMAKETTMAKMSQVIFTVVTTYARTGLCSWNMRSLEK